MLKLLCVNVVLRRFLWFGVGGWRFLIICKYREHKFTHGYYFNFAKRQEWKFQRGGIYKMKKLLKHVVGSDQRSNRTIGSSLNKLRNEKRKSSHPVLPFAWRPVGYVGTHGHPVVQNPNTGHIFGREQQGGPFE